MYISKKVVSQLISRQFGRFLIVGATNTVVGLTLYALFLALGFLPQVALILSFIMGVVWNFLGHAQFVFKGSRLNRLPAYFACYVCLYCLNAWGLHQLMMLGLGPLISQTILAPAVAILSFAAIGRVLTGKFPVGSDKGS